MSSSVIVLCPNGHRVVIQTTPNTYLSAIKNQACEKQGFNPANFGLRRENYKAALDLSFPFRLSGLLNKAKLELIEQQQKCVEINVALQLDSGGRLMGKMANTSSLAEIIKSIASRVESVDYVIYMQQRVNSDAFTSTSLVDLGVLKGSVMLRLHGVKAAAVPESTMEVEIEPEKTDEVEADDNKDAKNKTAAESENSMMETEVIEDHLIVPDKAPELVESVPILFNPSAVIDDQLDPTEAEDFFDVTDRDLKYMLRDIHRITQRQFKFADKVVIKAIPDQVVFRIRFPNGCMLQNVFQTRTTTTDDLYRFVEEYLTPECSENLHLYQAPPKKLIERDCTLIDAELTQTTLLHAGGDIELKSNLKVESDDAATKQLSAVLKVPAPVVKVAHRVAENKPEAPVGSETRSVPKPKSSGGTVPKWFKTK